MNYGFNTMRPEQNGRHFGDDIIIWIFLEEHVWISIQKIRWSSLLRVLLTRCQQRCRWWSLPSSKTEQESAQFSLFIWLTVIMLSIITKESWQESAQLSLFIWLTVIMLSFITKESCPIFNTFPSGRKCAKMGKIGFAYCNHQSKSLSKIFVLLREWFPAKTVEYVYCFTLLYFTNIVSADALMPICVGTSADRNMMSTSFQITTLFTSTYYKKSFLFDFLTS